MDAAIVDLDDCYLIEDSGEFEETIYSWTESLIGDARRSSFRTLKELTGFETEYDSNEEIDKFVEDFDDIYAVTLRPFWRNMINLTEEQLGEDKENFDEIIMYPGRSLNDKIYRRDMPKVSYLPLGYAADYKAQIVSRISEGYDNTVFIDDSTEHHSAVNNLDLVVDQYYEDLNPYDGNDS